jgi:aromatic-L-amino-acid/L-tryptophan decarboxylase
MDEIEEMAVEESLDPADWQDLRALGHRMLDEMMTYLETVRERPVWQPIPEAVRSFLKQPLPLEGQEAAEVYEDFKENVLPYPLGNIHPRFWGWVNGTGTPFAMLAEMLAAGMNPNVSGFNHVSVCVETQVLDWCKQMLGYTMEASGILVSGGSMANLVGLTVARNARAGLDVTRHGLQALEQKLTLYGSGEMHYSIQKGVELLGLGSDALRKIAVNKDFQIDTAALEAAIAEDRTRGLKPFCIVGNAGTVNTGATDDLNELANICEREGLWFHVDGAFGAFARLSPALQAQVAGIERADSLAFDLHKWMYMPYEAGCTLVRHAEQHRRAFATSGAYLSRAESGLAAGSTWFSQYGIQLSRGFRALKIWMSLKEHGIEKYRRLVEQNVEQARYLKTLIEDTRELELLAPVPLNVVCFRYLSEGLDEHQLKELNEGLLIELQESGVAVPSSTLIDGKYALRVAITNHRSRREDFDILIHKVLEIGRSRRHTKCLSAR